MAKSSRARALKSVSLAIILLAPCAAIIAPAQTQQDDPSAAGTDLALPFRAPGYELYYHGDQAPNAFATRWGYHDGWTDGRHDRDLGLHQPATDHDRYKLAPDHGMHPGLTRDKYKGLYRIAYLHGYEQGSKS